MGMLGKFLRWGEETAGERESGSAVPNDPVSGSLSLPGPVTGWGWGRE